MTTDSLSLELATQDTTHLEAGRREAPTRIELASTDEVLPLWLWTLGAAVESTAQCLVAALKPRARLAKAQE